MCSRDNQTYRRNLEASLRSTPYVLKNNVVLNMPWFRAEHLFRFGCRSEMAATCRGL